MMWFPFLVVLALFAMFFGRRYRGDGAVCEPGGRHRDAQDPVEILKRRYAGGEIGKEEFDEIREKIHSP